MRRCFFAKPFIKKLFLHIPDNKFHTTRYYGFYSNKVGAELDQIHTLLGDKKKQDYSREVRNKKKEQLLHKLKYRAHLIDTFNRYPLKCKYGNYLKFDGSYNPLEGLKNERQYRKKCLDELNEFSDDNTYQMFCPECDNTMFEKGNMS